MARNSVLDRVLTEEGLFYLLGIISIIFSMWLVINFGALPAVFFGYTIIILSSFVWRFMKDSDFFESLDLFHENLLLDIAIGIGLSVIWYFIFLPSPYGILPLPPLPANVLAVGPATFLIVVLLAPIAEEYFFRGSLLPQIEEIFGSKVFAILISSLLFGAFHWTAYLQGALSSALIASVLFGIFVGSIAVWRRSILPGIIIHAIINFAIVSPVFAIIA